MKKLIVLAFLSMNVFAAAPKEIAVDAVKALLKQNPSVNVPELGGVQKISDLLPMFMLSSFGANGKGELSVLSANCTLEEKQIYSCSLNSHSSDRIETNNGSYAPADDMTESSLNLIFKVKVIEKAPFLKLVGPVTAQLAG